MENNDEARETVCRSFAEIAFRVAKTASCLTLGPTTCHGMESSGVGTSADNNALVLGDSV